MTYVHDKKKQGKKVDLDKAFNITGDDKKRAIAVNHTIDTNRRGKDGVKGGEPAMKE